MRRLKTENAMREVVASGCEPYRGTLVAFNDYDGKTMRDGALSIHARQSPTVVTRKGDRPSAGRLTWEEARSAAIMAEMPLDLSHESRWTHEAPRENVAAGPLIINGREVARDPRSRKSAGNVSTDAMRKRAARAAGKAAIAAIPQTVNLMRLAEATAMLMNGRE